MNSEESRTLDIVRIENLPVSWGVASSSFWFFFLPDGGEGYEKNRDGHYWGYIARKAPGDTTKMGI